MTTDTQKSQRNAAYVMIGLTLIMAVRCMLVWSALPDPMASHFDNNGVPNAFQSRATFMSIMFGVLALLVFSFVVAPRLMRFIPPKLLNLPYRSYWIKRENVGEALDRYATWSMWFGCGTFVLMLCVFELALQANLKLQPMNPTLMWTLLGAYLVGTLVAIARLYAVFKPPR